MASQIHYWLSCSLVCHLRVCCRFCLCFGYEQEANPFAAGALVCKEVKSWQMKAGIVFSTCEEQPASVAGTGCKRLKPVGGAVLQVPFLGPLSCCRVLLPAGLREWDAGCPAGLAQPWTSGCLRERLPSKLCVGPRVCACPALLLLGDPSGS